MRRKWNIVKYFFLITVLLLLSIVIGLLVMDYINYGRHNFIVLLTESMVLVPIEIFITVFLLQHLLDKSAEKREKIQEKEKFLIVAGKNLDYLIQNVRNNTLSIVHNTDNLDEEQKKVLYHDLISDQNKYINENFFTSYRIFFFGVFNQPKEIKINSTGLIFYYSNQSITNINRYLELYRDITPNILLIKIIKLKEIYQTRAMDNHNLQISSPIFDFERYTDATTSNWANEIQSLTAFINEVDSLTAQIKEYLN